MQNKNFYREFNKPIHQSHINMDDAIFKIFIAVVLLGLSLLSYGFWDAIINLFSQETKMKLSKETIKKLWATTDAVSDGQTKKKVSRAKDQLLERK